MADVAYRLWFETIDVLSAAQPVDLRAILAGRSSEADVMAALEGGVSAARECVRCGQHGVYG